MTSLSDNWPSGGEDFLIQELQEQYLPTIDAVNITGLLRDERLGRVAIVSSFGADSVVLLHYLQSLGLEFPVVFLETGRHFPETLDYVRRVETEFGIQVIYAQPREDLLALEDPNGDLWSTDPDMCCRVRKTIVLQDALERFDTWISGRKRFQASTRAALPLIERDGKLIKVNPLALWEAKDIRAYMLQHELPPHPLVERGYPSIGCACCTMPVGAGEDPRSGRWAHSPEKTECGIHLGPDGRFRRR